MAYDSGDNSIVIVGGANMKWDTILDDKFTSKIRNAKVLLMQREIPEEVNIQCAKVARENDTLTILDMGGRDDPLSQELIALCDIISPN